MAKNYKPNLNTTRTLQALDSSDYDVKVEFHSCTLPHQNDRNATHTISLKLHELQCFCISFLVKHPVLSWQANTLQLTVAKVVWGLASRMESSLYIKK